MSSLWELLPGIPDEVTLTHIVTKLRWKDFQTLFILSPRWQQAIQSRKVYDERVRSNSTETLAVVKYQDLDDETAISLYSMRDKAFYHLPPIPHLEEGIPTYSQFVSLAGTLYLLAEMNESNLNIYSLDLAGQGQWKECASIPRPLLEYDCQIGCGVLQRGKFYVRGGSVDWFETHWHLHGGARHIQHDRADDGYRSFIAPVLLFWANWSVDMEFWVQGNIYCVKRDGIHVYNTPTGSWTLLHSKIACGELGSIESVSIQPLFILPLNKEILAIVRWERLDMTGGYCLLQSRGFGTESTDIVWEKGPDCFQKYNPCLAMCPIQL